MADVAPAAPSSASAAMTDQDALLNERISKARSELAQIHKYIGRARGGAPALASDDGELLFRQLRAPISAGGAAGVATASATTPTSASERLLQLSRSEHTDDGSEDSGRRTDRMRLAELSDVRNEKLGRAAILKWNPRAQPTSATTTPARRTRLSPAGRVRSNTSPRTSAKLLGEYSKDFVQQALDFDNVVDDEEVSERRDHGLRIEPPPPSPSTQVPPLQTPSEDGTEYAHDEELMGDARSPLELRKYVKQMEETIAQLVQQKDELLRNQAEFDKHASGIFPSLEHLNHQLSQIVQGKLGLQQSQNSRIGEDGADGAIKGAQAEDVLDELRVQRGQIQELEAEAKRRKYDADLQEQSRATEMTQIKGQIVSLVTSGKLHEEKNELLADSLKKVERELSESTRGLLQRYQLLDKRVNQLQTPLAQPRLVPVRSITSTCLRRRGTILF